MPPNTEHTADVHSPALRAQRQPPVVAVASYHPRCDMLIVVPQVACSALCNTTPAPGVARALCGSRGLGLVFSALDAHRHVAGVRARPPCFSLCLVQRLAVCGIVCDAGVCAFESGWF